MHFTSRIISTIFFLVFVGNILFATNSNNLNFPVDSCFIAIDSQDSICIPDGTGVTYFSTITISDFASGATLTSINDLAGICINMEHSFLGDLEIILTCPSGQSVILHEFSNFSGGGYWLGNPIDGNAQACENSANVGTGETYCWTSNATNGTFLASAGLVVNNQLPPGNYSSFESFNNLVGCPLNGDWTLSINDAWGIDDGVLFNWSVNFGEICTFNEVFVDQSATGSNDGLSWGNAFVDLQDALALGEGVIINVAEGIYTPTTTLERGIAFELQDSVTLLGGFPAGGGTRNPDIYITELSGDIDSAPDYSGNSYHVVKIIDADSVTIDGIHIKGGSANNPSSFGRSRGGGIYCKGSELTLTNCVIRRNQGIYGAGLFATLSPEVIIENSEFKLNTAEFGSAIYHSNQTNMFLSKARIIDNTSTNRCAIEINNSLYTEIDNCLIANNQAPNANAIAFVATNRNQTAIVRSSTILGGSNNKSIITMLTGFGDQLDVTIHNSIVAHQQLSFNKNVVAFNNGQLNFNHNNCYFQGSSVIGTGVDNLFSTTTGNMMLNSDYSLDLCSPLVNEGNGSFSQSMFDINGDPRVHYIWIDIGAFETQEFCDGTQRLSNSESESINIHPNPVNDIVFINTNLESFSVVLYDMIGKEILRSNNPSSLNMKDLPQGIYVLQIFEGKELKKVEKLIKE